MMRWLWGGFDMWIVIVALSLGFALGLAVMYVAMEHKYAATICLLSARIVELIAEIRKAKEEHYLTD